MSPLALRAQEYLMLRRSLGHKLEDVERLLPRLIEYLQQTGNATVTIEAALAWAQRPDCGPGSSVPPRRMSIARGFARFMSGIDPATEVPPVGLLPSHRSRRIPYLYNSADIQALMSAAGEIPTPLRAATYHTLIGLLATTGMRVGEAIRLHRTDIDWDDGVLVIRETKFGKSRELPLHPTTVDALAAYARFRDRQQPRARAASFFVSTVGTQLIYANVGFTSRGLGELDIPEPWRGHVHASVALIDDLELRISEIEHELGRSGADHRYLPLLMTAPGIGWVTGFTIAAEIGEINRFASPVKLTGCSGLCPRIKQSGDSDQRGPVSKHGPRYLRWG